MKLRNETVSEFVDTETGELMVLTSSKTYNVRVTTDSFYLVFLSVMDKITSIGSGTDLKILSKLCTIAEYNTGIVLLPSAKRKEICEEMGFSLQTFSNSLVALKRKEFISGKGGMFKINPMYFWKGDLKTRERLLKEGLEVNFTFTSEDLD